MTALTRTFPGQGLLAQLLLASCRGRAIVASSSIDIDHHGTASVTLEVTCLDYPLPLPERDERSREHDLALAEEFAKRAAQHVDRTDLALEFAERMMLFWGEAAQRATRPR